MIKYSLPEWTFLNGNSHEGDVLKGRTIFLHFPSFTILEVIPAKKLAELKIDNPAFQFQIIDEYGNTETLQFFIHCTLSHDLDRIYQDSAIWYCEYLKWEESNVLIKQKSKQN